MPKFETFSLLFMILCTVQLLFPILASKIDSRFNELGYEMKSEPMWSLLTSTNFWGEARKMNRELKDSVIAKLLFFRTAWWVAILMSLVGLIASDAK